MSTSFTLDDTNNGYHLPVGILEPQVQCPSVSADPSNKLAPPPGFFPGSQAASTTASDANGRGRSPDISAFSNLRIGDGSQHSHSSAPLPFISEADARSFWNTANTLFHIRADYGRQAGLNAALSDTVHQMSEQLQSKDQYIKHLESEVSELRQASEAQSITIKDQASALETALGYMQESQESSEKLQILAAEMAKNTLPLSGGANPEARP